MLRDRYHYDDVPAILEALQAEDVPLSAGRVLERRAQQRQGIDKGGSLGYIQEDINRWKREHGLSGEDQEEMPAAPATITPCNPVAVAEALNALRLETSILRATAQAEAFAGASGMRPPAPDAITGESGGQVNPMLSGRVHVRPRYAGGNDDGRAA